MLTPLHLSAGSRWLRLSVLIRWPLSGLSVTRCQRADQRPGPSSFKLETNKLGFFTGCFFISLANPGSIIPGGLGPTVGRLTLSPWASTPSHTSVTKESKCLWGVLMSDSNSWPCDLFLDLIIPWIWFQNIFICVFVLIQMQQFHSNLFIRVIKKIEIHLNYYSN